MCKKVLSKSPRNKTLETRKAGLRSGREKLKCDTFSMRISTISRGSSGARKTLNALSQVEAELPLCFSLGVGLPRNPICPWVRHFCSAP